MNIAEEQDMNFFANMLKGITRVLIEDCGDYCYDTCNNVSRDATDCRITCAYNCTWSDTLDEEPGGPFPCGTCSDSCSKECGGHCERNCSSNCEKKSFGK